MDEMYPVSQEHTWMEMEQVNVHVKIKISNNNSLIYLVHIQSHGKV